MVGRRRIELAEEVLADFYEARDIVRWVRSPMAYSYESSERPGREQDDDAIRGHRDTFYVPLKRLSENAEFFARMRARRYRVIAAFGPESARAYQEINEVTNRITVSAKALMRLDPRRHDDRTFARQERLEQDVWEGDEDEVSARVDAILSSVEERFRKEIIGDTL